MEAVFALGPSRGAPKEPREPILRHLGRVPFSMLILDPKKHPKSSISKVFEPRKLSSRLHGSSIFTFSLVSCPNPKIIDFGISFGSLLGPFWLLFGRIGLSWASRGRPWDPQGPLLGRPFFRWIFGCSFGSVLDPQTLQNGRGPSSKTDASLPLSDLYGQALEPESRRWFY